mmetsp:Transcript_28915/g.65416  ORF Transcript_28915/g.65416 Transcript_28915/m.65416 type:complete len:328 (+) Transcript_28915:48-1031(+)
MGQTSACCRACENDVSGEAAATPTRNSAFVFIKPHAVTDQVKELVRQRFESAKIRVVREAQIDAETIDEKRLIDRHYGAIASRAVLQQPSELLVQEQAKAEFQSIFGVSWGDALSRGLVFNAAGAAERLGVKPLEISEMFDKLKRGVDQVKFGGGFYVGKVEDIYVVNGFYTRMRAKYTAPNTCIHYFEVEWDPAELSWQKFRAEIIGATNPLEAAEGSIRSKVFDQWSSLGLKEEPDTGDNGVHASASPFEGLAEKNNWIGVRMEEDPVGKALISAGIGEDTIQDWVSDPAVFFEGKKQSLFDLLEDLDVTPCLEKAIKISSTNSG